MLTKSARNISSSFLDTQAQVVIDVILQYDTKQNFYFLEFRKRVGGETLWSFCKKVKKLWLIAIFN